MIKVLHPGMYSSVQDQGRLGFAKMGVPVSGAMDSYSSKMANILLKNHQKAATIEITFGAAKLEFTEDTYICVTGADFSPKLNEDIIEMSTVYEVVQGSVLTFGKRKYGVRTYVAVQGGIQTEELLKSKSFYSGITSQFQLKKGDELPIAFKKPYNNRGFSKIKKLEELFSWNELVCYPGPEFHQLKEDQIAQLKQPFSISEDNNRVGYRLNEVLKNDLKPILTSAVLPGTVQLTPAGKLIILMRDAQVTGGYPRVLQLSSFAIDILSQKMTGEKIQFKMESLKKP